MYFQHLMVRNETIVLVLPLMIPSVLTLGSCNAHVKRHIWWSSTQISCSRCQDMSDPDCPRPLRQTSNEESALLKHRYPVFSVSP